MSEESGLEALLEAVKAAARGEGLEEALRRASAFRQALASTIMESSEPLAEGSPLVEAYLAEAADGLRLLEEALRLGSGLSAAEARVAAGAATGLLVSDGRCVAMRALAPITIAGARAEKGAVFCAPLRQAPHLEAAGLAEALETGLAEALPGRGEEQHISLGGGGGAEGALEEAGKRGAGS